MCCDFTRGVDLGLSPLFSKPSGLTLFRVHEFQNVNAYTFQAAPPTDDLKEIVRFTIRSSHNNTGIVAVLRH